MDKAIVTTSWDDGHPLDLKLAELLQKYDVPATFYIPIDNVERDCMSPQQIREVARSFDIGGHTYHHLVLTEIPLQEVEKEIVEGKKRLEDIIGREVVSFCYPRGKYNDEVIDIVRNAGFIGARTVRSAIRSIKDPFKMDTTAYASYWHFGLAPYFRHAMASQDFRLFNFMLKKNLLINSWDRVAVKTLDFVVNNGGIWHLWGHSWSLEDNNNWVRLEKIFHNIGALSNDIRKMSNSQLLRSHMHEKDKR